MNKKQGILIGIALMLLFMLITVPVIANSYVWKEPLNTIKFGESGIVIKVVDGDTIDVEDVGRIRLADINTPEIDTEEGKEAKEYVKGLCDGSVKYEKISSTNALRTKKLYILRPIT